ncbi:hypothetical protein HMPREF1982_02415 [Clostridiales bacterium oral taxon 876 str. F0540]|nr:hypothetical protein HMPREF1982_02415 [Clostridiales bacterium oral taxon 876 str. F0540]
MSQNILAQRLRKSVRTAQRYISELVELGLIKVIRRDSTSNAYKMLRKIDQNTSETSVDTAKVIRRKCKVLKKESKGNYNNILCHLY